MMATTIDGVAVTGPMLHIIYALMEYFIPTTGAGFLPAAAHLAFDFLVLDPFFVACFFFTTGLLESRSLKTDILPTLRRWVY